MNWWTSFWSGVYEVAGLVKARFTAKNTASQQANADAKTIQESKDKAAKDIASDDLSGIQKDTAE